MQIDLNPHAAQAIAKILEKWLKTGATLRPDLRDLFTEALAEIQDALDNEAERQYLDRQTPNL